MKLATVWLCGLGFLVGGCSAGADQADTTGPVDVALADEGPDVGEPVPDASNADVGADVPDAFVDVCAPTCSLAACSLDDGCGTPCPPCPSLVSCADCSLRLVLRDVKSTADGLTRMTLDIVYDPAEGAPRPTLAEIRLALHGPAKLLSVTPGAPLADAGKLLAPDPESGAPFQRDDDVLRVVVLSSDDLQTIGPGTWMSFDLRLGGAFEPATQPVWLELLTDDAVLAPPDANLAILAPGVDAPVAVWPP